MHQLTINQLTIWSGYLSDLIPIVSVLLFNVLEGGDGRNQLTNNMIHLILTVAYTYVSSSTLIFRSVPTVKCTNLDRKFTNYVEI